MPIFGPAAADFVKGGSVSSPICCSSALLQPAGRAASCARRHSEGCGSGAGRGARPRPARGPAAALRLKGMPLLLYGGAQRPPRDAEPGHAHADPEGAVARVPPQRRAQNTPWARYFLLHWHGCFLIKSPALPSACGGQHPALGQRLVVMPGVNPADLQRHGRWWCWQERRFPPGSSSPAELGVRTDCLGAPKRLDGMWHRCSALKPQRCSACSSRATVSTSCSPSAGATAHARCQPRPQPRRLARRSFVPLQ